MRLEVLECNIAFNILNSPEFKKEYSTLLFKHGGKHAGKKEKVKFAADVEKLFSDNINNAYTTANGNRDKFFNANKDFIPDSNHMKDLNFGDFSHYDPAYGMRFYDLKCGDDSCLGSIKEDSFVSFKGIYICTNCTLSKLLIAPVEVFREYKEREELEYTEGAIYFLKEPYKGYEILVGDERVFYAELEGIKI